MNDAIQELLKSPELIRKIRFDDDDEDGRGCPSMHFYVIRCEGWNAPVTLSYLGCRDTYIVTKAMLVDMFPEKVI